LLVFFFKTLIVDLFFLIVDDNVVGVFVLGVFNDVVVIVVVNSVEFNLLDLDNNSAAALLVLIYDIIKYIYKDTQHTYAKT